MSTLESNYQVKIESPEAGIEGGGMKTLTYACPNGLQVLVKMTTDGKAYVTSLCPKGSKHNFGITTKRSAFFDEAWEKGDVFMFVAAGMYNALYAMAPPEVLAKQDALEQQGAPASHRCDA